MFPMQTRQSARMALPTSARTRHGPCVTVRIALTSLGMTDKPPEDPGDHAQEFAFRWADRLDQYCVTRMDELGIPDGKNGEKHPTIEARWRTFVPEERTGGFNDRGITVNSGVLNHDLLKGKKGGRIWLRARLRDRIDAIIAHEWEELGLLDHEAAIKAAAKTELPITDGGRRILRAMAR
jgi:hypothetical protein